MLRSGQVFRVDRPIRVNPMTSWAAVTTGSGIGGSLAVGEEFVVEEDQREGVTSLCCVPVRKEALHPCFVSESDRSHPLYRGYYLVIDARKIVENCSPVRER